MGNKEQLDKLLQDLRDKKYREGEAKGLLSSIQEEQTKALKPVLENMVKELGASLKSMFERAVGQIKVNVPKPDTAEIPPINIPEIKLPVINVPTPRVSVNVPDIKVPDIIMPEEMEVKGWISMLGYDKKFLENPFPVQLRDANGNPVDLAALRVAVGGGGGGKADFFTIKGFSQSAYSDLMNADGRIRVSVETGGSGLTDSELRATAVPVSQVSGANWSVSVSDIFGSTGANIINPDGRIKVELPTGSSGLTDTELRAAHLDVQQVSGAVDSTNVVTFNGNTPATGLNEITGGVLRVVQMTDSVSSVVVNSMPAVVVTSITNTTATNIVDSSGVAYSGSNPVPVTGTVVVSSVTASTQSALIDSSGVQYSGSNPVPTYQASQPTTFDVKQVSGSVDSVSVTGFSASVAATIADSSGVGYSGSNPIPVYLVLGSGNSTISVGPVLHDAVDSGSAPQKVGGTAMQANPTAVAGGDIVRFTADDLGRQLVRPVQVRDLIKTAYVSLTTGTEATLLAGVAGAYLDCIMITATNSSTAATQLDIRATTAGNIIHTMYLPAESGPIGWSPSVPWPQDNQGNSWTIDMPDQTGTTVYVSALFSQEV